MKDTTIGRKGYQTRASALALALALAGVLAACAQQSEGDAAATGAGHVAGPHPAAQADASPAAAGFDIAGVPVSERPLGDFPYFSLPAGYGNPNRPVPVRDFDRVAVWTGDRLEWIEGRIFESFVHAERGKGWSKLEVIRNLDHQVEQAGGVKVTQSKPSEDVVDAWDKGQAYSAGRGDIYNNEVSTWLLRRPDRDIWLHFTGNTASGSWMVVESATSAPGASLPAAAPTAP